MGIAIVKPTANHISRTIVLYYDGNNLELPQGDRNEKVAVLPG